MNNTLRFKYKYIYQSIINKNILYNKLIYLNQSKSNVSFHTLSYPSTFLIKKQYKLKHSHNTTKTLYTKKKNLSIIINKNKLFNYPFLSFSNFTIQEVHLPISEVIPVRLPFHINKYIMEKSKILDGKKVANEFHTNLKIEVNELINHYGIIPGLAIVLIGNRTDSTSYVNLKKKACKEIGIKAFLYSFPSDINENDLLKEIDLMNKNKNIHGILIQLPLPNHLNENNILASVDFEKDVDGLNPLNISKLCVTRDYIHSNKYFNIACTPKGCLALLDYYKIPIKGKNAVIIGRSKIVGIPMAMLLLHRDATVTICHSKTENLIDKVKMADILIVAVGKPLLVKGEWIKEGAIVIDVGINSIYDESKKNKYRLVGDVEYDKAKEKVSAITPVPGGVGPMTIAMLLLNTVKTAANSIKKEFLNISSKSNI